MSASQDQLADARLHYVGRIAPQRAWGMARHRHVDRHELIVVLRGALAVEIHGRTFRARAGEWLVYPRECWHTEQAEDGEPLETLFLVWSGGDRFVHELPTQHADSSGHVQVLVRWLREVHQRQDELGRERCAALLRTALLECAACAAPARGDLEDRVADFCRARLADPLTLTDIARHMAMSPAHFVRRFKSETGATPMAFLRRLRVDAAWGLLVSTDLPLRAIAESVGLGDPYHLSRVVRRLTGRPPGALRGERP